LTETTQALLPVNHPCSVPRHDQSDPAADAQATTYKNTD